MPPMFHNPIWFATELIYTLIVLFLCFLIYFKTKEIYDLTKHKGISYFRNTFLFFGLAYVFRFIFSLIRMTDRWIGTIYIPRGAMMPIMILFTAYFSTMALLFLIYSTIWKRFSSRDFFIAANILAVLIAVAAALSPPIFLITQAVLLVVAIVLSLVLRSKKAKFSRTALLYFLMFAFWIISLILVVPGRVLGFEIRIALEVISIALFGIIYYKVSKWTK
ncbi:hypothetical protein KY338_04235 [Candidatus Woesearchaeota archaeon]|nr:hypothetical protein [Candidatus Woesearchaeota archaeon]MBW3005810.1 hypothetical protein [Candidatus Woesearchaeota archaeon]